MTPYPSVTSSALFRHLEVLERPDLLAHVKALRSRVDVFLRGVNATFAHYTSHAVDHSDQIVRELSNLLFEDPTEPNSIVVQLNGTETFLLLLAAYLHDSGMVVTGEEKLRVLSSEHWADFAANNRQIADDVERLQASLAFEADQTDAEKLFCASLEQQLLLAEYFRRLHADRAETVINGALSVGRDYLSDDPVAIATLTAICVGHGLSRAELSSQVSYPTRRDIFAEPVHVRLLTILLRLGDLLDTRYERACPLLRSNAFPLPSGSRVHWTQYQRITSRVTSPSMIEIRAECESADEHRLLRDWCGWLVDEVRDATGLLRGSDRHAAWKPPKAVLGETIHIERARGAHYRAGDWKFHFDEAEVLTRLIRDVHGGHQFGFLQELIQNALDTSRARAYVLSGSDAEHPTDLPKDVLDRVAVTIRCIGGPESVTCVEVEDRGLGMTEDLVQNYFLQIGRSWYRSPQFARDFHFNATSRFGIGFLSVFAVSENVCVTTRWHESESSQALRMTLPGARNYLLFEDAARADPGTTVRVELDQPLKLEALVNYLSYLCVANEIPIVIDTTECGHEATVTLPVVEGPSAGDVVPLSAAAKLVVREISSTQPGVFGALQFYALEADGKPEDWAAHSDKLKRAAFHENPLAEVPLLPDSCTAVNGLRTARGWGGSSREKYARLVIDLRGPDAPGELGLDRQGTSRAGALLGNDVGLALNDHLAGRTLDAEYTAALVRRFESYAPVWADTVSFIPTLGGGSVSWAKLETLPTFSTMILAPRQLGSRVQPAERERAAEMAAQQVEGLCLDHRALRLLSPERRRALFNKWSVESVRQVTDAVTVVSFGKRNAAVSRQSYRSYSLVQFEPESTLVRLEVYEPDQIAINGTHPFVEAVMGLGDETLPLRNRLLTTIAGSTYGEPSLLELTRAVADLRAHRALTAYADYMTSHNEYHTRYFGAALHLPTVLPQS